MQQQEISCGDKVTVIRAHKRGFVHRKKMTPTGVQLYGVRFEPATFESAGNRNKNSEYCDCYVARNGLKLRYKMAPLPPAHKTPSTASKLI